MTTRVLLLVLVLFACLSPAVFARVDASTKQVDATIASVSKDTGIRTTLGMTFLTNSAGLLAKADGLKGSSAIITYYERDGKNYCLDVEAGTGAGVVSTAPSRRVVPEKRADK